MALQVGIMQSVIEFLQKWNIQQRIKKIANCRVLAGRSIMCLGAGAGVGGSKSLAEAENQPSCNPP